MALGIKGTMENITNSSECYKELPSVIDYIKLISEEDFILLITCLIICFCTLLLSFRELYRVNKSIKNQLSRTAIVVQLGINPLFSVASIVILLMPRTAMVISCCKAAYYGYALYQFVILIESYFFGESGLVYLHKHDNVRLNVPPLFCCCICLPTMKLTMKYYQKMKNQVIQAAFVKMLMVFFTSILYIDGIYSDLLILSYAFSLLDMLSTLLAVYRLMQLLFLTNKRLQTFAIRLKFISLQLTLILPSIASIVIRNLILQTSCFMPPLEDQGQRIICYFTIFIMLPLSLLSASAYSRGLIYEDKFQKELCEEIEAKFDEETSEESQEVSRIKNEFKLQRHLSMQYQEIKEKKLDKKQILYFSKFSYGTMDETQESILSPTE